MFEAIKRMWKRKLTSKPQPHPQMQETPEPKTEPKPRPRVSTGTSGDTEERKRYLAETLPQQMEKIVEEWREKLPEVPEPIHRINPEVVTFPTEGFTNSTEAYLTMRTYERDRSLWILGIAAPTRWDDGGSQIGTYLKRGGKEEVLSYVNSREGLEEIRECLVRFDNKSAHDGPFD